MDWKGLVVGKNVQFGRAWSFGTTWFLGDNAKMVTERAYAVSVIRQRRLLQGERLIIQAT